MAGGPVQARAGSSAVPTTASLGPSSSTAVPSGSATAGGEYPYRARALYNYDANKDDPNEMSFSKGDIIEIANNQGKWWQGRMKTDAGVVTGICPSNYLQII